MKRLIEDLLMFSRVGGSMELQPIDCERVLAAVLDSLSVALAESQAVVTHDPLPFVQANRMAIEQVLQNLIGNAVKYRSELPPHIHVAAEQSGDTWRLMVADNGMGFEMVYAERIFQVFQRLHPRGRHGGTGIGLAVCKRIVESCHGQIGVESAPGAGSTFWFTLPSVPIPPIQEESHAAVGVAG
jgi:light-regulated signal transduction histidine kinase (bacteriophytochrome)